MRFRALLPGSLLAQRLTYVLRPSHAFPKSRCFLVSVTGADSCRRHRGIKRRRKSTRCYRRDPHFFYDCRCIVRILHRLSTGESPGGVGAEQKATDGQSRLRLREEARKRLSHWKRSGRKLGDMCDFPTRSHILPFLAPRSANWWTNPLCLEARSKLPCSILRNTSVHRARVFFGSMLCAFQ